jgi:hypothetical protein
VIKQAQPIRIQVAVSHSHSLFDSRPNRGQRHPQ